MKEFDWEGFKRSDNKTVVHCGKETEAIDFLEQAYKHGLQWCGYFEFKGTCYDEYKDKTCYSNYISYSSVDWYERHHYTILEWSDYMQQDDKAVN